MTANVRNTIRSRPGTSDGSASAAASETAPRMPAQEMIDGRLPRRVRIALADAAEEQPRHVGEDRHADDADHDHRDRDDRRVGEQRPGHVQPVDDPAQLQPDEREEQRVDEEDEDLPERVAGEPRLDVRQLRRVPAHVDADRHRGQHARDADRGRGQVGEVAGEERDRDLGRRVVDAAAHLADDVADGEPDRDAADHVDDEAPGRVPERERARDRGGDGGLVDDERDAVVDEALALDDRDDAPRRADRRATSVAASASVGETIAPSVNAPAQPRPDVLRARPRRRRPSSRRSPTASSEIGRRFARRSRRPVKNAAE